MACKYKKPQENRKYTLMIVPHQGKSSVFRIHLPMKLIKYVTGIVGAFFIVGMIFAVNYGQKISTATAEKAELEQLRQTNFAQKKQIDELSNKATILQEDMNRLNQLESDVRKLLNPEDTQPSRSSNRPNLGYTGKGGPVVKPELEQIAGVLDNIQNSLQGKEQSLLGLRDTLLAIKAQQDCTPSIWPAKGDVTSRFGLRSSPWGGGGGDWHPGIDIANEAGTPIQAAADGVVVYSGWYSGYGKLVQIDHGNSLETLYGHCSELIAQVGQKIKKGDIIAYMGSTGWSTGPHVHYEVRKNGKAIDPAGFLNN